MTERFTKVAKRHNEDNIKYITGISDDLHNTISNIGSNNTHIIIDSIQILTSDLTIPPNITIEFINGGGITGSYNLVINGPLIAGRYQIFDPTVTIQGWLKVSEIYPEWFGVVGDGVTDDTDAIQFALDTMKYYRQVLSFASGVYLVTDTLTITELDDGGTIKGVGRGNGGTVFEYDNVDTEPFLEIYGSFDLNLERFKVRCNANEGILFGDTSLSDEANRTGLSHVSDIWLYQTSKGISFQCPGGYNYFDRIRINVLSNGTGVDIGSSYANTSGTLPNYMFFTNMELSTASYIGTTAFDLNCCNYVHINKCDMARFAKGINIENDQEVSNIIVDGSYFFNAGNASISIYIDTGAICRNITFRDNNHLHSSGTFINVQAGTYKVYTMLVDGDFIQGSLSNGYILNNVDLTLANIKSHFVDLNTNSTIGSSVNVYYNDTLKPAVRRYTLAASASVDKTFEMPLVPVEVPEAVVYHEGAATITQSYSAVTGILTVTTTNDEASSQDFTAFIP